MQDENSLPEGKGDVLIYKALQQVDIFSMNTEKSKLTILCEGRCERKLNKIYWKAIYWKSDWWVVVGFGFLFVCFEIEDLFIEGNHKMEFSGAKNDHELRMMVAMHLLSLLTKEKEKLTCLWKKKKVLSSKSLLSLNDDAEINGPLWVDKLHVKISFFCAER